MKYKRVLLKLSGEALSGNKGNGFDEATCIRVAEQIRELVKEGCQIAVVIGGGNFWRGRTSETIQRNQADQIGMLATVMNCIYMSEICRHAGLMTQILTPFECGSFTKLFSRDRVEKYLAKNMVVSNCTSTVPMCWRWTTPRTSTGCTSTKTKRGCPSAITAACSSWAAAAAGQASGAAAGGSWSASPLPTIPTPGRQPAGPPRTA